MTEPMTTDEATGDVYFVRKNGYYYRPNSRGYTSSPWEAGRYSKEDAETHIDERAGVSIVRASEVMPDMLDSQSEDAWDKLRDEIVGAFIAGAKGTHDALREDPDNLTDPDPNFKEAAYDYFAALEVNGRTDRILARIQQPAVDREAVKRHLERMASTGNTGSLEEWGEFSNAIIALIQPAVKVKPLRWHDRPSESVSHHSSGLFEEYKIDWHGPDEFYLSYRHVGFDTTFLTLEAAKAAAQRHYDNAIREALEPVSDGMVMVSREPTDTQLDRALHSLGSPNPKESKVWLRAFYRAMLSAAPTGGE